MTPPLRITESDQSKAALDQIRGWLKAGCTIKAIDPNGKVLEPLPDGSIHGGLEVQGAGQSQGHDAAEACAREIDLRFCNEPGYSDEIKAIIRRHFPATPLPTPVREACERLDEEAVYQSKAGNYHTWNGPSQLAADLRTLLAHVRKGGGA